MHTATADGWESTRYTVSGARRCGHPQRATGLWRAGESSRLDGDIETPRMLSLLRGGCLRARLCAVVRYRRRGTLRVGVVVSVAIIAQKQTSQHEYEGLYVFSPHDVDQRVLRDCAP